MSRLIGVIASSGLGKTTSLFPSEELGIEGLDPTKTVLINVAAKPLPLRGADRIYPPDKKIKEGGNYLESSDFKVITEVIEYVSESRPEVNCIVLDDSSYLMGFEVMKKANVKDWDKWTILASKMFNVVDKARTLRRNLNIVFLFHIEKGDDSRLKIKTSGNMIDKNIYLDGLFTFIFEAVADKSASTNKMQYRFRVKGDGLSTVKSPVGVFDGEFIPNDMGLVIKKIEEYYA